MGAFGHHCNPGPILPHLYVENIVLAQKLAKLELLYIDLFQKSLYSFLATGCPGGTVFIDLGLYRDLFQKKGL